jgi:hypothetical protein
MRKDFANGFKEQRLALGRREWQKGVKLTAAAVNLL